MTLRPTRARTPKQALAGAQSLQIGPASVSGTAPPGPPVALVADGICIGVAARDGSGAFTFALPAHLFARNLDVLDTKTGRSVLPAPVDFTALRQIQWNPPLVGSGRITGRFAVLGQAAPARPEPLLIEFAAAGITYARGFAHPAAGGAFHYDLPVGVLPPFNRSAELQARLAGYAMPGTLPLSAADCGYAGHLDATEAPLAQGWVVDLARPSRRVKLDLLIDGKKVATGSADRKRPDIAELGLGNGNCGFAIPFPGDTPRDKALLIDVAVAEGGPGLCDSPYLRPAPPPYIGFFDAIEGPFVGGWLVNMHHPDTPLTVEAVCAGQVVGSGVANVYRGDVQNFGMPTARCGFRFPLERSLPELFDKDITMRVAGTDQVLAGSPRQISQNDNITRFLTRRTTLPAPVTHRLARHMTASTQNTGISIIMPVFDTPRQWLVEALRSVLGQWSANWELICVDDGSTAPHVAQVLGVFARLDRRVRILRSPANAGIARAVNFGLRAAQFGYVAFMDHDDVIEPDAIYHLARTAQDTGADLIYSDEVLTAPDIDMPIEVRARPAFSHDFYLSHPYFVHMVCVRTAIARRVSGWDETLPISADVDFVLRVIEAANAVAHIPRVLYRWRTHVSSTGHSKAAHVTGATQNALARHLARLGHSATVHEGLHYNGFRVDWPDDGGEVLIVIPTKNRVDLLKPCIDSIEATSPGENIRIVVIDHESSDPKTIRYLETIRGRHTVMPYAGPFNYARMNNLAVRTHAGRAKYVLFLNNDVEATEPGWIARLRSLAARTDVGAVGPLLLYADDRVQHGGVLVGFSGAADHAMKFANAYLEKGKRDPGYNCNLTAVRDYSAVTAACMMVRRDVLAKVRGFDEAFVIGFNDTDLCLRIRKAGFKVLYDGFTLLYHHESATRTTSKEVEHPEDDDRLRQRWSWYFRQGDPFYSPLLAPRGTDHTLRNDTGCKGRMRPRVITVQPTPSEPAKPEKARPAPNPSKLPLKTQSQAARARRAKPASATGGD